MDGADDLGAGGLGEVAELAQRIFQRPELVAALQVDGDQYGALRLGSYVNQPRPGGLLPGVAAVPLRSPGLGDGSTSLRGRDCPALDALAALLHLLVWGGQGQADVALAVPAVAGAGGYHHVQVLQEVLGELG